VERDPALCRQILRLANPPCTAAQQIHSIQRAIAMAGIGTMRKFTLASSLFKSFAGFPKPNGFSLARFKRTLKRFELQLKTLGKAFR
jgi:HD-like signal output (HDOD) protein